MRSVADHLQAVLAAVGPLPRLAVVLSDAVGCVLADDVQAPSDLPVTDLAAVDGYAVRSADLASSAASTLPVVDDVRPGGAPPASLPAGAAMLISSGSPMPPGADAVVPLQDTDRGSAAVVVGVKVAQWANVHRAGSDAVSGEVVLRAGDRVGPREVALLAAIGLSRIEVHPRPRVVIVTVGDELLEPGKPARAGQVFDANGHALASAVTDAGGAAIRVGSVPDTYGELREMLEDQLVRADLIITTGGLSHGPNDTVSEVVGPLGIVRFDDVAISPGRRFGVGEIGDEGARTPILCLPGGPVAVQVAVEAFVRPALRQMAGHAALYRQSVPAKAARAWDSPSGIREFVPARITGSPAGGYQWEPVDRPDALTGLVRANALAVIPEHIGAVVTGDEMPCLLLEA